MSIATIYWGSKTQRYNPYFVDPQVLLGRSIATITANVQASVEDLWQKPWKCG